MKIEYKKNPERHEFFRSLYEGALLAMKDTNEAFDRHMRQYRGSYEIDGSSEPAATVRNITYEIIESQVSSDIPAPKVDPECYSEGKLRNAHTVERLCYAVRDRLPFEVLNDIDERYTYVYGSSVWYVEWDHERSEGGRRGGVRVHCLSPKALIPQPGVHSIADMEYCFLKFTTAKGELSRKYGIPEDKLSLAECEYESPPRQRRHREWRHRE